MRVMFIDTVHGILQERLSNAGFKCENFTTSSLEEIQNAIPDFEGIVIRSRFRVGKELLNTAGKLRFIARFGSGMENIDVAYAASKGVKCYGAPEGNANAVAEHALGMLLSLFRNMNRADTEVRQGIWEREGNRGLELDGRTVGIIGYGHTGSAFAKKLQGFDVKVKAYDKYKSGFGTDHIEECSLEDIHQNCDVVSLHVPLTEETKYMVNEAFIQHFQNPVWVMNTSRGAVVNTEDLVAQIREKKVLGACLDVLEYEKTSLEGLKEEVPANLKYLRSSDKVMLTPHIAGWTHESYRKLSNVLADKILKDFPNGAIQ